MSVAGFLKRPEHAGKIEIATAEGTTVGFAEMEVADARSVEADGFQDGALFDVEMDRVEHVAEAWRSGFLNESGGFGSRVVEADLQVVDRLQDDRGVLLFGSSGDRLQAGGNSLLGGGFVRF